MNDFVDVFNLFLSIQLNYFEYRGAKLGTNQNGYVKVADLKQYGINITFSKRKWFINIAEKISKHLDIPVYKQLNGNDKCLIDYSYQMNAFYHPELMKRVIDYFIDTKVKFSNFEQDLQNQILEILGEDAHKEVQTPIGKIDLITKTQIIEVKTIAKWKHALGQILAYGHYYPDHVKTLCLFGKAKDQSIITTICAKYDVRVIFLKDI